MTDKLENFLQYTLNVSMSNVQVCVWAHSSNLKYQVLHEHVSNAK